MPTVYRLKTAGLYRATEWGDLIHQCPRFEPAQAAERRFILSGRGTGVDPLALVGTLGEIRATLDFFQDHVVENQLPELPQLYVGIRLHEPGPLWDGLYPLEEIAKRVFRMAAAVAPVPDLKDVLEGVAHRGGIEVNLPVPLAEIHEFVDEHGDDMGRIRDLQAHRDQGRGPCLIHPEQALVVILHYLQPKDSALSVAELPLQARSRVLPGPRHEVQDVHQIGFVELGRRLRPLLARVTTTLPSFDSWKASSSAGRLSMRRRSRILAVDHAYLDYLRSVDVRAVGGGQRADKLAALLHQVHAYRDQKDAEGDHGQRVLACDRLLQQLATEQRHLA